MTRPEYEYQPPHWTGISPSPQASLDLARSLGRLAKPGDLILLSGPLGAGKTLWVRGLAEGLRLDSRQVSSPTFVIAQEYDQPAAHSDASDHPTLADPVTLVHVDAYRLTSASEMQTTGWDLGDPTSRSRVIIAIEWPENLDLTPDDGLWIELCHLDENQRQAAITFSAGWKDRADAWLSRHPQDLP